MILLDPHSSLEAMRGDDRSLRERHHFCHEHTAKRIAFNKLDPTMTFGIYLRNRADLETLKTWNEQMKRSFNDSWLFSAAESKP